jgi:hypothetical protein
VTLLFISIILIFIIYQDLKTRTIHVLLPVFVFIFSLTINFYSDYLTFNMIIKNIGFVVINILGLVFYFSIKNKSFFNPIDKSIGLGDILFFLSITPLFNLNCFVLFFVLSFVFSLILHLVLSKNNKKNTIPLAGYMSIFLLLTIFAKIKLNLNLIF